MANEVEVQYPDGSIVVKTSENITDYELEYQLRCPWINKQGIQCATPMVPVRKKKPTPHLYFRQLNDNMIHLCGCPNNHMRESSSVTRLDYRALGQTTDDLAMAMIKDTNVDKTPKKKTGTLEFSNDENSCDGDRPDIDERPVKRNFRIPRSPGALAGLLIDLGLNDKYANKYVKDLIVDYRTVDNFRQNGIPSDDYVLVLAKKLAVKNRDINVNNDDAVLVDCKYNASINSNPHRCLHYRLPLTGKMASKMYECFKRKSNYTHFAIFAKWEKDPDNENTYIAVDILPDYVEQIRIEDRSDKFSI